MGCSASCSSPPFHFTTTTITTTATAIPTYDHPNAPSNSSDSSPSAHHFHSPFSDHYYNSSSTQTPVSRTMSLRTPLIHHPPLRKGDSNHFVSLTSTTYGSLITTTTTAATTTTDNHQQTLEEYPASSPDSVINTWELMEGLDEDFNMIDDDSKQPNSYHGKRLNVAKETPDFTFDLGGPYELVEHSETKPLWKHLSEESLLSKLDSNLVSSYNKALYSKHFGRQESKLPAPVCEITNLKGVPKLSGREDKIVLYYTSLRGIRKTYEDCCEIRLILKGFQVFVDERDISMDSSYRKELQGLFEGKGFTLPQLFIRGKNVGGADEIKQLHEEGKLFKLVEGFPVIDPGFVCDNCGDARFLPCPTCNGSRKVFEEDEGRSIRCPDCNENGLIRCATCCC